MNAVQSSIESTPEIELEQVSVERNGVRQNWSIGWRITNRGVHLLYIQSVRLPHGQFKAEERSFEPALVLSSGQEGRIQTAVRCNEPAGLVTENAFLIFQVMWLGEPWRIFVRVRVVIDSQREPATGVELITTQKIGFSRVTP